MIVCRRQRASEAGMIRLVRACLNAASWMAVTRQKSAQGEPPRLQTNVLLDEA